MSRMVRFNRIGGPEVLQVVDEVPRPPGAGQVRIRVEAIGLNRAETLYRAGRYLYPPRLPSGLGYEVVGLADAVGDGIEHVRPGERVATVPAFSMADYALYGEVVTAPGHAVVPHPEGLSPEEGAAVWMQYVTAYGALVAVGRVAAGDWVLLTAATGGLGVAGVQVAKAEGARVIATTRKPAKRAFLEGLGADRVVVTSEEDLAGAVHEATGGAGPHLVLDAVMGPTLAGLAALVAPGGSIVAYGAMHPDAAAPAGTPFPLLPVIGKGLAVRGYTLFELTYDPARFGAERPYDPVRYPEAIRYVRDGLAAGRLQPAVDRVFPFARIAEAHAFVETDGQSGKVVVSVP